VRDWLAGKQYYLAQKIESLENQGNKSFSSHKCG